jgi:hypothetical protein
VLLTLTAGVDARAQNAPQLRPVNPTSGALMADAQQKSATVRELIGKLEASNLVVYVNVAPLTADSPESGLRFIGSSKVQRFVLISVSADSAADRRIELLGHELRHAVEVAGASWVRNDIDFQTLISRVGWRDASQARGYETTAATATEHQVRHDVRAAVGTHQ